MYVCQAKTNICYFLFLFFFAPSPKYKRAFKWFCPKIGATECPFECGGGGPMANEQRFFYVGASLRDHSFSFNLKLSWPLTDIRIRGSKCGNAFNFDEKKTPPTITWDEYPESTSFGKIWFKFWEVSKGKVQKKKKKCQFYLYTDVPCCKN